MATILDFNFINVQDNMPAILRCPTSEDYLEPGRPTDPSVARATRVWPNFSLRILPRQLWHGVLYVTPRRPRMRMAHVFLVARAAQFRAFDVGG